MNDFLIYDITEHLIMKVSPFRAMMNVENKDLIYQIREKTIETRQKAKIFTKLF